MVRDVTKWRAPRTSSAFGRHLLWFQALLELEVVSVFPRSCGGEMEGIPSSYIHFPSSSPCLVAPPTDWTSPKPSSASRKLPTRLLAPHLLPTLPIDLQSQTILLRHQLHPTICHPWHNCLQCQLLTINTHRPPTMEPRRTDRKFYLMTDNRAWGYS